LQILRTSCKKGEKYYWVLYVTYVVTPVPETLLDTLDAIEKALNLPIPTSTYYKYKAKAKTELAKILKFEIDNAEQ